jgi:hypothetical protein
MAVVPLFASISVAGAPVVTVLTSPWVTGSPVAASALPDRAAAPAVAPTTPASTTPPRVSSERRPTRRSSSTVPAEVFRFTCFHFSTMYRIRYFAVIKGEATLSESR